MSETKSLVRKLTEVMQKVKHIPKNGYNKFHKYHFATESDVAEKVREELAERCVMMIPDVTKMETREHKNRSGATEYIVTVWMKFTFMDGESGEEIVFNSVGEGQDAGDKGSYKAITGAQKYALLKAFMIPTGDDPEADTDADKRNKGDDKTPSNKPDKPSGNSSSGNRTSSGNGNNPATEKQLKAIDTILKEKINDKWSYDSLFENLQKQVGTQKELKSFTFKEASKALDILKKKN
jgi:hypothetical protein